MRDRKGKETHKGNVFKLGTALGSWSSVLLGDLGNNIEHTTVLSQRRMEEAGVFI